jgi:hypothetical protein
MDGRVKPGHDMLGGPGKVIKHVQASTAFSLVQSGSAAGHDMVGWARKP